MTIRASSTTIAVGLLMIAAGCGTEVAKTHLPPTVVTLPDPANPTNNSDWTKDADGHMVIHVAFSRDVRRDTVEKGLTFFLKTPRQTLSTEGSFVWKSDHEVDFVTAQTYDWLIMAPDANTNVTLTLYGTRYGPNSAMVITDKYGHALDGDSDGVEGGNYTVKFGIPFF